MTHKIRRTYTVVARCDIFPTEYLELEPSGDHNNVILKDYE